MDVVRVMFTADGSRREFPVQKNGVIIGRTNSCGLRVPLSSVSREHCEISIHGDEIVLRDLGSSNGTYHNNLRIQEAEILPGDEISIGPVVFTVVVDGKPEDIEPVRTIIEDGEGGADIEQLSLPDSDDDMEVLSSEKIPDGADASVRELAQALASDHEDLDLSLGDDEDLAAALESDLDMDLDIPDIQELDAGGTDQTVADALESDDDMDIDLPTIEEIEPDDDKVLSPIVELDDPLGALEGMSDTDDEEFPELVLDDDD